MLTPTMLRNLSDRSEVEWTKETMTRAIENCDAVIVLESAKKLAEPSNESWRSGRIWRIWNSRVKDDLRAECFDFFWVWIHLGFAVA
jgi:hypothetical protein